MARIVELKAAEAGYLWVKIEVPGPQGEVSIYTRAELDNLIKQTRAELLEEIATNIRA